MNRNIQIERAIGSNLYCSQMDADGFRLGAYWADSHPIFTDRIPVVSMKTPGEVLSLTVKLCDASDNHPLIQDLLAMVRTNIEEGLPPFENIEHIVLVRKEGQQ